MEEMCNGRLVEAGKSYLIEGPKQALGTGFFADVHIFFSERKNMDKRGEVGRPAIYLSYLFKDSSSR
jgi:hypothetical protein